MGAFGPSRSPLRGAAPHPILLLLLATALAFALLLWLLPDGDAGPPDRSPDAGTAPTAGAREPERGDGERDAALPAAVPELGGEEAGAPPPRFDGTGTVRGSLSTPAGTPFPERWTLVLSPNPGHPGSEHAVTRRVDFEAGERDFEVADLPLGAYRVRAEAERLNGRGTTLRLERGREQQWIGLTLQPPGFLEGEVVEEGGAPLPDLPVQLQSLATDEMRVTRTDANGVFVFEDVLDGEHRLHFGASDNPALGPRTLNFRAPSMRFPTVTAPRRARIALDVLDTVGVGVSGAEAWAEGPSGRSQLETDASGRCTFLLLAAGSWRVSARHPELGTAAAALELAEGEHRALELVLER